MPVKSLDNLTVFECATFVTGPYATSLLADLGARVIKIESTPDGDPYRVDERFKTRDARQNYKRLEQALAPTFKSRTREQWLTILEANDVPAVPLYNVAEVLDDPQVKHLGLTEKLEHPKAGTLKYVGGPVRFDNLPRQTSAPLPLVGEHSGKVLRELGNRDDDIAAFQS